MKQITHRSDCPLSYTLDFFGDKWSLLILRDMALYNKRTFGEFQFSDEKIATNILADRLTMLETNGFITKKVASVKKSKFVYTLMEKGISLVPLLLEIGIWGSQHHPPGLDTVILKNLKKDKEGTIAKIQAQIRKNMKEDS
jgi:DNA-binding HxlR family transcriptional regulator